jgi:hypothetical protein
LRPPRRLRKVAQRHRNQLERNPAFYFRKIIQGVGRALTILGKKAEKAREKFGRLGVELGKAEGAKLYETGIPNSIETGIPNSIESEVGYKDWLKTHIGF